MLTSLFALATVMAFGVYYNHIITLMDKQT